MPVARELWKRIESIHAVTYFAPESRAAAKQAGLRGFWMGYFGFRAAPLGCVPPGPVHASFAGFAQTMVERSLPDAWSHASPSSLLDARVISAASALRRLSSALTDDHARAVHSPLDSLVQNADPLGRPLFAANAGLAERIDAVEKLWQLCTTLREHRGDGHVIALASHCVDGCEAHRLHAATHGTPHELLRDNRGFSDEEWRAAAVRLEARGLMAEGDLTDAGRHVVESVEALTDALAGEPIKRSGIDTDLLLDTLTPIAKDITASGVLPFPNPMGLPRL